MPAFDYINGEQIDLNRQDHRDTVIQRNRELLGALKFGLPFEETKAELILKITVDCVKCGDQIQAESKQDYDGYPNPDIPTLNCNTCQTKYVYKSDDDTFSVKVPKPASGNKLPRKKTSI